jgi:3-deoxy-D-manno-octulosonate 8-phosphate phosphatase (KDO 8-P phosphatase)
VEISRTGTIRLVLTDCDGVLTDGSVYYGEQGEVMKKFHIRDGMGVKLLLACSIEVGVVTGEKSLSLVRRCEKLGMKEVHLGASNKLEVVTGILGRLELGWSELAYIGDDVNDLEVLSRAGLSACPSDAHVQVRLKVGRVLTAAGGHGAFREFSDLILRAQTEAG